jgi:predicted RNA binding protein YcfA (HicA-like mRNA interferase family)
MERALERGGFVLKRHSRTGGRIFAHPDGRVTGTHPHKGSDRFTPGVLRSILAVTGWTEEDARRLGLL